MDKTNCAHDCKSCVSNCKTKDKQRADMLEAPNKHSRIKNIIGIASGKGGVGKSLVTSMLAVLTARLGYKTAILDADITGPSIPKIFGIKENVRGTDEGMYPVKTATSIDIMSVNLLLDNEKSPVAWRGPVISGTIKQFWSGVMWGDTDYMFIDMPPGTGDVPLTVFQSIPIDGVIIVTSPQELVSMIVAKAINMANLMDVPVLGIIENMSYIKCPDCGSEINVFGESSLPQISSEFNIDILARIPLDPKLAALCDKGILELMDNEYLYEAVNIIEKRTEV